MLNLFDGESGVRDTFRFVEEKLSAGSWSWDLVTGKMQWSDGLYALLDLAIGSVEPSYAAMERRIHPDDRRDAEDVVQILKEGLPVEREYRVIKQHGRMRWILNRAEIMIDSAGQPTRAIGVCFDVTRHREAVQPLESASARYHALIEATDGAVNMTHEDGRVSRVGGISIDPGRALPADRWADLTHPDDRIETDSKWAQAIASRTAQRFEHRLRQPDGSFRWSRTVAAPVKNQHGAVVEWIGVTSDVDLEMNYAPDLTRSNRLTGTQIRAARGILGWSVKDLADKAQISPNTVRRYEEVNGAPDTDEDALIKIRSACESAKIEFIFPHAGKPGVRLR